MPSNYDNIILADNPTSFLPDTLSALVGANATSLPVGRPVVYAALPNGDSARVLNGIDEFSELADVANISIPAGASGEISIEAWIRPDTLQFPNYESSGYIHVLGKSTGGQHEYALRMFNLTNTENKPNRMIGYVFDLDGSPSAGAYYQETEVAGVWVHVVVVISKVTSNVKIYKNGVLKHTASLGKVNPSNGTTPFRMGTRNSQSFFQGAIGKCAIYQSALTPAMILNHYNAMITVPPPVSTPYDLLVLQSSPVLYLPDAVNTGINGGQSATFNPPNPAVNATMPNGDLTRVFNGSTEYSQVPDLDSLSIVTSGYLTVEAWIRPDVLDFPSTSDYIHWMGKGVSGQHEWALRMYNLNSTSGRPNRISDYAWNLAGGLGAGSYVQQPVTAGEWIHIVAVYTNQNQGPDHPTGYIKLYKNGVLIQNVYDPPYPAAETGAVPMNQYDIIPANGTAPMRIGTRDMANFFLGAIGKVAVYPTELSAATILSHYNEMMP